MLSNKKENDLCPVRNISNWLIHAEMMMIRLFDLDLYRGNRSYSQVINYCSCLVELEMKQFHTFIAIIIQKQMGVIEIY